MARLSPQTVSTPLCPLRDVLPERRSQIFMVFRPLTVSGVKIGIHPDSYGIHLKTLM
jgi:hypothetical protein